MRLCYILANIQYSKENDKYFLQNKISSKNFPNNTMENRKINNFSIEI